MRDQRTERYQYSHNANANSPGLTTSDDPIQVRLRGVDDCDVIQKTKSDTFIIRSHAEH